MPPCSSCGAPAAPAGGACPKCGARSAASPVSATPDLELDVPKRPAPRAVAKKKAEEQEATLELAVEPRSFVAPVTERTDRQDPGAPNSAPAGASALARRDAPGASALRAGAAVGVGEVAFDARLLAEYGDAPRHWLLSPVYALRVLRRQRELKRALAGRREEAARAAHEVEDALVAFAERIRPVAEKNADFARPLEELRGAEDVLRSRDRVLASEQDAQTARLASVDARLAKLEAELAHAQAEERKTAADLASTQAALARGESKLKRAESELRSAQQRESDGSQA
jgi:hypothetical protein